MCLRYTIRDACKYFSSMYIEFKELYELYFIEKKNVIFTMLYIFKIITMNNMEYILL